MTWLQPQSLCLAWVLLASCYTLPDAWTPIDAEGIDAANVALQEWSASNLEPVDEECWRDELRTYGTLATDDIPRWCGKRWYCNPPRVKGTCAESCEAELGCAGACRRVFLEGLGPVATDHPTAVYFCADYLCYTPTAAIVHESIHGLEKCSGRGIDHFLHGGGPWNAETEAYDPPRFSGPVWGAAGVYKRVARRVL